MSADWSTVAALALAVGAAAFTLAKTKVTEPVRLKLALVPNPNHGPDSPTKMALRPGFLGWLGSLVNCPYCLGHWLSAVAVLIYQPRLTDGWLVTDLGVSWLAVTAIAAVVSGLIDRAIHPK